MTGLRIKERMDVERLVTWALREQGLGWVGKDRSRESYADYGTMIDEGSVGSHPQVSLLSDDDALVVKFAIDSFLPLEARALVTQYGRAGLRPDWAEEGEGSWEQDRDGQGRLRWRWEDPVNRTGAKEPLMVWAGLGSESVRIERATYGLWWQGLADIVGPLNMRMAGHMATGPEAPMQPWLEHKKKIIVPEGVDAPVFAKAARRPVYEVGPEERLRRAQEPVRAQARDWGHPDEVVHRSESGKATGTHGRS